MREKYIENPLDFSQIELTTDSFERAKKSIEYHAVKKALKDQKESIIERVEELYVGWMERTKNRDVSQDDAFEDGAEVFQKKVLQLLNEMMEE